MHLSAGRAKPTLPPMFTSRQRQKQVQAVVYFATHTRHCGKVKLFKLLYLLDFGHFRQVGTSVTGYDYQAWRLGPVPADLMQDWDALPADLAAAIEIRVEKVVDYVRELIVPKVPFDASEFTPREQRLMQSLAEQYRDEYTRPLVEVTHRERDAWDVVWEGGRGKNQPIPYRLALKPDDPFREAALEVAEDREAAVAAGTLPH